MEIDSKARDSLVLKEVFMSNIVSIFAEIPEDLHDSLRGYLDSHPHWDLDRVFATAISLFLLQNGSPLSSDLSKSYQACARAYLDKLYQQAERS
jgi:hypothetical protein